MTLPRSGSRDDRPRKHRHAWKSEIIRKPILALRPAPENEKVYRPIVESDLAVSDLIKSVAQHGVKDPLVITLDNVILSGHRRHFAAGRAGLETVPCVIEPVQSDDPQFLELLTLYNKQRVKSADEILREQVINTDPNLEYQDLLELRRERARVAVEPLTIKGTKHRSQITGAKRPMLEAVLAIIEALRDFWPLTDRTIHYQLLNDPPLRHASKPHSRYANNRGCYNDLTDLLTRARVFGDIPWDCIHDPTRPVLAWNNLHREPGTYIGQQLDQLFGGYWRDLLQSQPSHVEIIGEKMTIENIIRPVASDYCIPYTLGRGYCSSEPRQKMVKRFQDSGKEHLIVLMLSDFDPEGEDIPNSYAKSLRDDFGIDESRLAVIKLALTAEQVHAEKLPAKLEAKRTSSRYEGFVAEHGKAVHELEAVLPPRLQDWLRGAIESVLDMDTFRAEVEAEKRDWAKLVTYRKTVLEILKGSTWNRTGVSEGGVA